MAVVTGDKVPKLQNGKRVVMGAHVNRGLSFPPSDFFLEVLNHYGLQPHHLLPNSIQEILGFVSLCEGYLGIKPTLELFWYYFQIKHQPISSGGPLAVCGSVSLMIRKNY